jgi:hypothetical protein
MGWDAELNRRLTVPLVVKTAETRSAGRMTRCRTLRSTGCDPEEFTVLSKLADNRARIEKLEKNFELRPESIDCSDIVNELDYLKASVGIGLTEIRVEIEDVPTSEEIFAEAFA